jgi:tetratricopeptide (TPR) repeat protein
MLGGSQAARAAGDDGITEREKSLAKKSYQHALELYKVGDYKAAAVELRKAYDYAPLPPILFNLGVTYMKLGNKSAAKAALSEYVAAMPKALNRAEADQLLAEIAQSDKQEAAAPAPLEEGKPAPAPAQTSQAAAAPLGEDTENPLEQQGARIEPTRVQERTMRERPVETGETRHLGVWKWSTAGASAACIIIGALMLNQASQQSDALTAAAAPPNGYPTKRYDSDVKALEDGYTLNKTWGTVAVVGGAALAATSLTLFVMDGKPSTSRRATLTPVVGGGVAAISLGGSF